jgi:hypothetical protein
MFAKRTTAALFAIAIVSSLIVVSSFLSLAFSAKKEAGNAAFPTNTMINLDAKDKSSSPKSQDTNAGYPSGVTGDTNGLSQKELKKLSKCESGSAADDDLTLGEVKDCYRQVFDQGQGQDKEDHSSSARGNDQSYEGQGEQQVKPSSLDGQKSGMMREGFPF